MSSWVKGECKHTREHLWQRVRSLFGGSGWRGRGCSNEESEAERGWSVRTYVGAGCSWGLVLLEALLWAFVHWLGKQSTSALLCSSAPLAVEARGGVLWTVTGCWDAPGWGFDDGSSPSPQKDRLRESARQSHAAFSIHKCGLKCEWYFSLFDILKNNIVVNQNIIERSTISTILLLIKNKSCRDSLIYGLGLGLSCQLFN